MLKFKVIGLALMMILIAVFDAEARFFPTKCIAQRPTSFLEEGGGLPGDRTVDLKPGQCVQLIGPGGWNSNGDNSVWFRKLRGTVPGSDFKCSTGRC